MKHKIIIIFCLLGCIVGVATAQNIVHPKIAGPNGLWVNSFNGVLFFGQTDMETQNTAMPMSLRFYYNSSSYATNYGYGLGFSLGYEMRYDVDESGNVTIIQGDGRGDTYKRYGTDYEAPTGVFSVLTKGDDGSYTLTQKDGTIYTFGDAQHRKLTAITDRNGNRTELTYTESLLTQISDAVGHTITLTYTNGLLTSASASFHQGSINYEYNSKGCLRKRTDAMGNSTVYAYDDNNRLEAITDANGHKTMIAYNSAGMCSRLKTDVSDKSIRYDGDKTVFIDYTEPKNQYSYYRWDDKGRVIEKVGLCCGIQSTLAYDDNDNVVRLTDANGNVTSYTYDNRGNMLSMTDALGNTERYTYDADFNQLTSFQDKNGNSYRFTYDPKGNLISFDGPQSFSTSYTYNDKGWLLTSTDANNGVARATYNADGTIANVTNAAGYTTSFVYDQCGNVTSVTDGRNITTTYAYDKNNQITSQTDALGHTSTVSYDKVGNIVRVKNAMNQIVAYTYDAIGNVQSLVNPKGGTFTYVYDGKGQLLSVTNPEGETIRQEWNEKGKLQSQTNGAGERTTYDYDAKGNLTSVFLSNGNVLNYFYDQIDRIMQISDNIGTIAKFTYDANGNCLSLTDGLDRTMTFTYDALNRRTIETLPSGATTTYAYDGNSNLLSVTDALGNVTNYTYSSLNQQQTRTDALGAKTQFEYDANGNLTKVTDAKNNVTTYVYDVLNHNTNISFANSATLQYGYDELGRVITSKDRAGQQFKYAYDQLGNLLSITYPDNSTDRYTYDGIGRLLSAVNKDATVSFTYDGAGRILSETLASGDGLQGTTTYRFDVAAGKRTITYPSGMKVEEHLNARDLITSILQNGNEVVSMSYNAAGQKMAQIYANGITTSYAYNENSWLDSIQADHGILNLAIQYDAIGNLTQRKDVLNTDRTESYGYDAISQLVSFQRGSLVNNTYQFDPLGNRIKMIENGVTTSYTSNNVNAYTNITGPQAFTPEYDEDGNLLRDASNKYAYDYNKNLSLAGSIEFKYDALGRRIAKGNTLYYYVGDQMVEEVNGNNTISYLFGNDTDEALQMKKESGEFYYTTNDLGSAVTITNNVGSQVESISYDVYGKPSFLDADNVSVSESTIGNAILFTGREYDVETGLYHYRARTYDPLLGRFIQKDPFMYIAGMNDYTYVVNSPSQFVDITGEIPTTKEAAEMARHVYGEGGTLSGGWHKSNRNISGIRYRNDRWFTPSKGFNSALYERTINGVTEYAYVTQGTNATSLMDWANNIQQGLNYGWLPGQYDLSKKNARLLDKEIGDCELTFVGHSLGGGLASVNALVTGRNGITFNAAGVSPFTFPLDWDALKRYYGGGKNIDANIIRGEILDKYVNINPYTGRAVGNRHYYEAEGSALDKHGMDTFLKVLEGSSKSAAGGGGGRRW